MSHHPTYSFRSIGYSCLLFLAILPSTLFCQSSETAVAEAPDKLLAVDSLLEIAKEVSPDSALSYAQEALKIIRPTKDEEKKAEVYKLLVDIQDQLNDWEGKKETLLESLPILLNINHCPSLVDGYDHLGQSYYRLADADSAIYYFQEALSSLEICVDSNLIVGFHSEISFVYMQKDDLQKALDYAMKAYALASTIPNYDDKGSLSMGIGTILFKIRDFQGAKTYFQKAVAEFQADSSENGTLVSLANLGSTYRELGMLDNATETYKKTFYLAEDPRFKPYFAAIYINLGKVLIKQERLAESLIYFKLAEKNALERNNLHQQVQIFASQAKAYNMLGDYRKSYDLAKKSYDVALEGGLPHENVTRLLAQNAQKLGRYEEAYSYFKTYSDYQDSLNQVQVAEQIKSIEATFQDSLKTQQNALLTQENALLSQENEISQLKLRRRGLIIGGLIFITVLILAALWQFYRQKKQIEEAHQKLHEKQEALLVLEKDKSHLIRLLSHDLQAPLGYIRNILYFLGLQKLPENLLNLIHNGSKNATHIYTLSKEISETSQVVSSAEQDLLYETDPIDLHEHISEVIQKYQPLASEKQIAIRLSMVSEDIFIQSNQLFLSHILGNLIQNAIKFSPEGKEVLVACKANGDDGQFVIEVTDQGPGIAKELRSYVFSSEKPPSMERDGSQGLYLSQQLAKAIHAKISYQTEVGKGSTFRLVGLA